MNVRKWIEKLRKNKRNPYEPDVEVNFASVLKRLFIRKKTVKQKPKF
jgi:hypothetical protein